jgi:hypothetical protein
MVVIGVAVAIAFITVAVYVCQTPRAGPLAEHYVDERVGDASLEDEWGLDALITAAERAVEHESTRHSSRNRRGER